LKSDNFYSLWNEPSSRLQLGQLWMKSLKSSMQHGMNAQGQQNPPERKRMPSPVNQAHPPDLVVVAEMDMDTNME